MKYLHSLLTKLILWLLLIITTFLGIYQTYLYHSLKERLIRELNDNADQKISRLVRDINLPMWELDGAWIDSTIETEMRDPLVYGFFVYENNTIIAAKKRESNGNLLNVTTDHLQGDFIQRRAAVIHNGEKIGEVQLYLSKTLINQRLNEELYKAVFLSLLVSILITFSLGYMIHMLILRPITSLLDTTRHIAKGEYEYTTVLLTNDEIGYLGRSVDEMKHQIQTREVKLQESLEELDKFFTVSLDLLCIADMEGNFLRLNRAWEQVLGYPMDEIYRYKFFDFIHPDDISATLEAVERLSGQNVVSGFINRYRTQDGSYRWFEWRSVPQGNVIYAAAHDMTETILQRQVLEEVNETLEGKVLERTQELREANNQLKELDKLKSMFIASMSHELRTPLNSIIGFAGVLLQGLSGPLNEKQSDQLRRVKSAGIHLLSLISDVIDISKIEAGRVEAFPEYFFLDELLKEAFAEMEILVKQKGLEFEMEPLPVIEMFTDKKRLYQCLLNYLSNAIKFTENGKVIFGAVKEGDRIRIWVKDTGIGIAERDKPRLFEAFERFETNLRVLPGGSGLGLYLTRKITETLLQGSVWVESKEGEGSVFGLLLPQKLTVEEE